MIEILRWFLGWSEFKIEGDLNEFLTTYKKNLWLVEKKKNFVLARCIKSSSGKDAVMKDYVATRWYRAHKYYYVEKIWHSG